MSDLGEGLLHQSSRRYRSSDDDDEHSPGFIVRLKYSLYLFVSLLLAIVFRGMMSSVFENVPFLSKGCAATSHIGVLRAACASEMLIYRISFALVVFFALHWLSVSDLTCCIRSRDRVQLQLHFFTVKTALFVLLFLITLFIPNNFFAGYGYVCLFSSALYLLVNVVFLVDFSYKWSDDWGERAEQNGKWLWYLLSVAVGSALLGVAAVVASYIIYVPQSTCNYNAFAITTVILGGFCFTILSIYVPHGSIVPSSIVFLYTSCIMFFTLRTSAAPCNRLIGVGGDGGSTTYSVLQGIGTTVVTCFTLLYSVVTAGGSGAALNIGQNDDGDEEDADESGHLSHYMFFYTIMIFGSMYLAMLGTNWHVNGAGDAALDTSISIAFWVRMSTVWAAMALYIWSLVAPYTCCKGRDFGFAVDDDWA